MIGFAIGLILGVPIGMYCWYRWGSQLAADVEKLKGEL